MRSTRSPAPRRRPSPARATGRAAGRDQAQGADPGSLASLDEVRAVSDGAAAKLDDYLAERGEMLVTGYDITALSLRELPGLVLAGLRTAAPGRPPTITRSLRRCEPCARRRAGTL